MNSMSSKASQAHSKNESLLQNDYIFTLPIRSQCTLSLPPKTSEALTVFWCFQGVEKGCIGNEWVSTWILQNIA